MKAKRILCLICKICKTLAQFAAWCARNQSRLRHVEAAETCRAPFASKLRHAEIHFESGASGQKR